MSWKAIIQACTLKEGHEYLIVEFQVENKGNEDLFLSSMMNFTTWCDGKLCTISPEALATGMFAGKTQLDCPVASGKSISGIIGYEVPSDWEEIIVEFKSDMLGLEKASFAVQNDR